MTNPVRFQRFAPDGRWLGFVVQDQPIERYEPRMGVDLCTQVPPQPSPGQWPYRINGEWVLVADPLL